MNKKTTYLLTSMRMSHPSDRFSITSTQNPSSGAWEYLLRRLDKDDNQKTTDTFTLLKEEAFVMFDMFLDNPEFLERAKHKIG